MSRTFRRRDARHEYVWVLRDWDGHWLASRKLDARSRAGRKAIAMFHADATGTMRSTAPAWYRKAFDRRTDTYNDRMLRRWFADPAFDPVFDGKHRHRANYSWW
jgi:hypothetical protein